MNEYEELGQPSLDVVGVYEGVGVSFQTLAPVQRGLAGAAEGALALGPGVLGALEPDVARFTARSRDDGVRAVGAFGAVHAAPCQQTGQPRDADAKHLLREDVVHALLQVRELLRQSGGEPAGDFPQEDA